MRLSRRGLMIGGLAGGGLAVAYLLRPREYPLPLAPGGGETAFDAWIKIGSDGVVSVAVPQLEMGQGVTTLIPQIVAMELGADWRQIAVEPAPVSAHYANFPLAARWAPMWAAFPSLADAPGDMLTRRWAQDNRFMATADGTSLAAYEAPARMAAAAARAMLSQAAAARWDVPWTECAAADGFIAHDGKRLPFAELAQEALSFDPPDPPPLRQEAPREASDQRRSVAPIRFPRLDLPSKVDGSHLFAGDVRLPGMIYAAIRHGPIGDAELAHYEKEAAAGRQGLIGFVRGWRWLAAAATNWWAAESALVDIEPVFRVSDLAESSVIEEALDAALRGGDAHTVHKAGDPDASLSRDFSVVRRYSVAPALHAPLETASATARLEDGRLELWVATQVPEATRAAAAAALGIDAGEVVLYPMPAGGSFDRRLEFDHAVEAALIARELSRPVQLVWSRWQEHVAGWPRAPAAALMAARTTVEGDVIDWRARIAVPPTAREFGQRLFGGHTWRDAITESKGAADPLAIEGAVPAYAIADLQIEHVPAAIGLPTARLRGNAHGYTAFFNECFVDELAHAAHREPLSFRMAMIGGDLRLAECLQRVAELSGWDGGADNSGQGLACHVIGDAGGGTDGGGGRIAVVASAHRDDTGVRVERISAVVDIGRIINLDIARQQIEGGIVFGLGLALGSSTAYEAGLPVTGRLAGLNLPLLADCPRISVDFIDSDAPPADPGEIGVVAVAPALANALFSATGLRFRHLPLLSEGL